MLKTVRIGVKGQQGKRDALHQVEVSHGNTHRYIFPSLEHYNLRFLKIDNAECCENRNGKAGLSRCRDFWKSNF